MGSVAAHKRNSRRQRGSVALTIAIAAVILSLAAGGVVLATRPGNGSQADATTAPQVVPLNVVATNPTNNATDIAPSTPITVDLSAPLAAGSPMPTLSPTVTGSWSALSPTELQFVGTGPLVPGSSETITVPGGTGGLTSEQGQTLASSVTVSFSVAQGSVLRLQQLLAQLGYLPVSFTPATQPSSPQQEADPQQGTFNWRWANLPDSLTSLWTPGAYDVVTKGAIMSFEDQHGLTTDGLAGPKVWGDVLAAAEAGDADPNTYNYVYVHRSPDPETVTVYQDGAPVYETPANTGVAAAPTESGTYPVFVRYTVTTMRGTNPDGSKYVDPGIPWVSYFHGGDALHGFVRGSYGYPQSDGCVEMPPANAAVVFPKTPIGTLVTVQ